MTTPESIEARLASLPASPGVYLMKDAAGAVIYVGKAQSLRSRVRSYFREGGDSRITVEFLRGKVADIETILTATDKEAILLENTLIKQHKPRYNIRLRDDKTYISLRLDTTHEWPRLHRVRRRTPGDKAQLFGPYTSGNAVRETVRFLQKVFPLRSCPDQVLANRSRPCILHQIGRCSAPCVGLVAPDDYAQYVEGTAMFLRGRGEEVVALLERRMREYSDAMLFEKAAMIRDRIKAIALTLEEEKVHSHRRFDRDVVAIARRAGRVAVAVLCFRRGRMGDTRAFHFADHDLEECDILESFLTQFYESASVPLDILLPATPANDALLARTLAETRGGPVHLRVPERGAKRRLLAMATQNADGILDRVMDAGDTTERMLANLRAALHLPELPHHIECFDISNFQGANAVGSMTCFRDGQPDKSGYRRFKIRTVEGQNDFAMMREVLSRRYGKAVAAGHPLPHLVVIDGGKGQLGIAVEVFRELGLLGRVPVAGLAKSRLKLSPRNKVEKDRTEERIFLPGRKNPVTFRRSDPALFLLQRVRDEAHRFAIEYHRLLRKGSSLRTGLEGIPGLGPERRKALLRHFGSLARLGAATREEIAAIKGIPARVAAAAWERLRDAREDGAPPVGDARAT